MFTSLEGKAKRNYQACDEKGDLSLEKILEKMEMIYRTSVSFRDLNATLCDLSRVTGNHQKTITNGKGGY